MIGLLTALATDPGTPAALLRAAHTWAGTAGNDGRRLHTVLATHPALPADLLEQYRASRDAATREALLTRPGTTAATALELLATEKRARVLRAAAAAVDDPTGALAAELLTRTAGPGLLTDLLTNPRTTAAARQTAAVALAAYYTHTSASRDRLRVHARRTGTAAELHAAARDIPLRLDMADLQAAAARGRDRARDGRFDPTADWFHLDEHMAGHRDDVDALLTAASAAPDRTRENAWKSAVRHCSDPTGRLAAAALAATTGTATATLVLIDPDVPAPVRLTAALRITAAGTSLARNEIAAITALAVADPTAAAALAATTTDPPTLRAILARTDLPPDVWATLHTRDAHGAFNDAGCSIPLRSTLASHPGAAPDLRRDAALRVLSWVAVNAGDTPGYSALGHSAGWGALARAGATELTAGPTAAGRGLPLGALDAVAGQVPLPAAVAGQVPLPAAVAGYVRAAVTATLPDTDTAAHVLVRLADGFPGTVGELADTAAAVLTPADA